MPELCKIHDFYTEFSYCYESAGVKKIRIGRVMDIDFDKLLSNQSSYFDATNKTFLKSIPLKDNRKWATLKPDFQNIRREAKGIDGKPYFDTAITEMRFQGYLNTKQLQEIKKISSLVVVSELQNGAIIIDGLDYDYRDRQIKGTQYIGSYFDTAQENSGISNDEIGIHNTLTIRGRQTDKGFKGLFSWNSMTEYYDFGIYVADNLFAFITDDGTLFTFK